MMNSKILASLFLFTSGCAGPMTPFGALGLWSGSLLPKDGSPPSGVHIEFSPERQVLHGASEFRVTVHDPQGIPEGYRVALTYNGMDNSQNLSRNGRFQFADRERRRLVISLKNLRLPPARDHHIRFAYWRSAGMGAATAEYHPPTCASFDPKQRLRTVPDFDPPALLIRSINASASARKLNPYLLAALIAQESRFDPEAVSKAKALGLTQITPLGEAEVIKKYSDWPRYSGVNAMSWPRLKLAIAQGEIHGDNEWRLHPEKSIAGGAFYLASLNQYWSRPEKVQLLHQTLGSDSTATKVLLASYNSGPARVSRALERLGRDYLQAEDMSEALKYVRQVTSYCDHFARTGE